MTADAYLVIRCESADEREPDGRCCAEGHWPIRFDPHTHAELRRLLKTRGWSRKRHHGQLIDLCPDHA